MERKAFYALLLAMLTTSLGVGLIMPLLPVYADTLGASGVWIGLIFGANPLVRAAFTLVVGPLADQMDKKRLMLGGLLGYAACSIGFILASSPGQLFLARVAQGAFSAMVMPVARAYAGDLAPEGHEGVTMGQFALAFSAGFALGPLIGGLLADTLGMAAPFLGMSGMSVLASLVVLRTVPSRPPALGAALRRRGLDFRPFADIQVVGLVTGRTFVAVGRGIFSTLMPLMGTDALGLTAAQTGFVVTARSTTEAVMQPIAGKAADRLDRRYVCMAGFLLMPLALLATPAVRSFTMLILAAVVLGLGAGTSIPAAAAIAVDKGRRFGMGSLMGLDSTAQALGMAAGATFGGALYEAFSAELTFRVAALACFGGAAVFFALTRGYVKDELGYAEVNGGAPAVPGEAGVTAAAKAPPLPASIGTPAGHAAVK